MKIYTKTGDKGTTSLIGGERVSKADLRVEAYGTVDELSAHLGLLRDMMPEADERFVELREDLARISYTLMSVEALLATPAGGSAKVPELHESEIKWLESRIDQMESQLEPVTRFTIPGGDPIISQSHVCRTVCRRAERASVAAANPLADDAVKYLNRLSDYLYQAGRNITSLLGVAEQYWEPSK